MSTAEGTWPKVTDDPLYPSEANVIGRIVASGTCNDLADTDGNLTGVITIPANTINNGLIVICHGVWKATNNGETFYVLVKADTSNPPTTVKQTFTYNHSASATDALCTCATIVITDLTASSVNYVQIYGDYTNSTAASSFDGGLYLVIAY